MVHQQLNSAESLQDAFHVFNELSQNLTRSYLELEGQVARLTRELAAARSERLKTLTEKERLANRLERLLQALPAGVLVTDGRGVIIGHNPAAERWLGEGLRGRCWYEVLEGASVPGSDNPHERRLVNGITVNLSISSLGEEPGQIVLLTDVSDMRALQELLSQRQRLSALGEMVASLAHQIRTPLSAALLYTSHLGSASLSEALRVRFAAKLAERLQHLERQVNDMLAFARLGRLAMERIRGAELVHRALGVFEPTLAGSNVRLAVSSQADAEEFYGNADALLGILLNLLGNAVEAFDGNGGMISLQLSHPSPGWLRITVSDNGPGIPDEIQERIFEPFFTTRTHGTGLGLAVVDCVVRAHGGRVACQSSAGRGASFQLDFPLATEATPLPGGFSGSNHLTGESGNGTDRRTHRGR